ncbi:similar to ILITYHIA [Actinidia rufa]|uniref:Similar to ILITYHIA n=1 Tax=Actinidia rufa TaxID=165716 RepID=A0A7J0F6Y8_9ERIC|nr:similar to ILITYHIA [Actinidia rufa]
MQEKCQQRISKAPSVKMLKRNPELVLESIGNLLKSVKLDLSKYATEILSVVLPEARHADKGRRSEALVMVGCLSQKSSNPDAVEAMFNVVSSASEALMEDLHFLTRELE